MKISIRPKYRFILLGFFLLILIALSILAIDELFFNFFTSPSNDSVDLLLFIIVGLPSGIIVYFFLIKETFYKIKFIGDTLSAPKLSGRVQKKIKIRCSRILDCKIGTAGFGFYFAFTCDKGKKHNMFITHFTNKQKLRIIKLIQERGGLLEYDANEIIGIKKKVNKKK